MKYSLRTTDRFDKEFNKLDKYTKRIIKSWIDKYLVDCENPRLHGKALSENLKEKWQYRIGDYRLICIIEDDTLVIIDLTVGHRKDVYRK